MCRLLPTNETEANACADHQCNVMLDSSSIIECHNTSWRLLTIATTNEQFCAEDVRDNETNSEIIISAGFYIINFIRICSDNCISRLMFRSNGTGLPSNGNLIQFHVLKKHVSNSSLSEYFVEEQSFNVTLSYNSTSSSIEATPDGALVCVQTGDYIGVTINEGLDVIGTSADEGSFIPSSSSPCTGLTQRAFSVNSSLLIDRAPLISVQYRGK